ncbi:hypothetical protein OG439_40745 [Amycolatopsis sp. NBC_01307]|uniref:hypothetical protein n=1 Tax=Amycolatopsis sp. NBC_01307 TaxID=2903561 RepID=UPI002E1287CB|nr:hypothetical protein OG439_40745 [Amycolatopsis sp. NBC_01307]
MGGGPFSGCLRRWVDAVRRVRTWTFGVHSFGPSRHPGFFGLINDLSRAGRLTSEQEEFRRTNHAWYEAHYTNPTTVDPTVYDPAVNPGATAWFKQSARQLVDRAAGYLGILDTHGVRCERLVSRQPPGRIVYEDADQIVVVPR